MMPRSPTACTFMRRLWWPPFGIVGLPPFSDEVRHLVECRASGGHVMGASKKEEAERWQAM
eukprot:586486-Prorocentrum_lima.AAC.1